MSKDLMVLEERPSLDSRKAGRAPRFLLCSSKQHGSQAPQWKLHLASLQTMVEATSIAFAVSRRKAATSPHRRQRNASKMPLEFVGDKQWIQFGSGMDVKNRTEIPAVRVSEGVLPKGSTWTRNPIPACNDVPRMGGHNHACSGPMFTPPIPGLYGFGPGSCASGEAPCTLQEMADREMDFNFGIVDLLKVPDVPPGDYVLGFRWDVEQLPQVWGNCADIKIEIKGAAKPTKAFSPWWGCEQCCHETLVPCANCTKCINDKTGDCAYCWNPLNGFQFGAIPQYQCLGHEAPDGGPSIWKPGMPFDGVSWSPGCSKCWATPDSCKPSNRESQEGLAAFPTLI